MAARHQLPGVRRFPWIHSAAIRAGVLTWIYASCAFAAWQLVAYGIPQLERFAAVRDVAASALTIGLLTIPVFRFIKDPAKLFISGLTAWTLLTLTYLVAGILFSLLESRMAAIQIFMLGAVSYGLIAVFVWVFLMCAAARHHHVAQSEHAAAHADHLRTR
jgi:hypothetical protein